MSIHKRILVIGGGPAGVQAALAAAGPGRNVTLISEGSPGGRATWQTLLPSKIWLEMREQASSALDIAQMKTRYERVAGAWQRQVLEELELAGVDVRLGVAKFLSAHQVEVTPPEGGYPDQIAADVVIVATGAVPFVPPGLQPDGERIFSPHTIWQMPALPESMVVIGAGGPATEYIDVFSRLKVRVTWITGPVGVLSAFPPDAGRFISGIMERRGVRIITGLMTRQIEPSPEGVQVVTADGTIHTAQAAFVAIGLRPDLERLNLPAAGLKVGSTGGLATDPYGRTSEESIYIVGDAASPLSANISISQGRVAGWHAAGLHVEPMQLDQAVMAIYTHPQVAMVGRMSDRKQMLQKVRVPFNACLRSYLIKPREDNESEDNGFLELAYDAQRRVCGALAACPEAAEILTPVAVAIRAEMTIDTLATVYAAHPTFTELAILAARMAK